MTDGLVRVDEVAGVSVVVLEGEVDALVAPRILERLPELLGQGRPVVLDLADVSFLDSAGVRLVDRLARSCAGEGVGWRVVTPRGSVAWRVLDLVGMTEPEVVVDDRAAALLQLAG